MAYIFTSGIKATDLSTIIPEGIRRLAAAGLLVNYTVCDGASENRSWINLAADPDFSAEMAAGEGAARGAAANGGGACSKLPSRGTLGWPRMRPYLHPPPLTCNLPPSRPPGLQLRASSCPQTALRASTWRHSATPRALGSRCSC